MHFLKKRHTCFNVRINHRARFCKQSELVKLGGNCPYSEGKLHKKIVVRGWCIKTLPNEATPFCGQSKTTVVACCERTGGSRFFSVCFN